MHILTQEEILALRQKRVNSFFKKARSFIEQSPLKEVPLQERKEIEKNIVRCLFHTVRFVQNERITEREICEILKYPHAAENLKYYVEELYRKGNKYKETIDAAIQEGMKIRRAINPSYPKEFGQAGSFYLQVENIRTAFDLVTERITMMNDSLPGQHTLQLVQGEKAPTLEYFNGKSRQTFRLNAFLMHRSEVLQELAKNFPLFDLEDRALLDTFKDKDYNAYKQLKSERMRARSHLNKAFLTTLKDEFLFYRLAHEFETHPEDTMETNICRVAQFYEQTKKISLKVTTTGREILPEQTPFQIMMFTRNPYEIATLSTYKEWMQYSPKQVYCLSAAGENFKYIKQEIGRGSIVVYGMDKDFIPKCRVILKPYYNQKGDIFYRLGRIKGEVTSGFEDQLRTFVNEHFNNSSEGIYYLPKEMHTDDLSTVIWTYKHPTPELILDGLKIPYEKTQDNMIKVKGDLSFEGMGLKELPDLSNVIVENCFNVSDNKDLVSLKGMPLCRVLKINQTGIKTLSDVKQGVQEVVSAFNFLTSLNGIPSSVRRLSLQNGGIKGGIHLNEFAGLTNICLVSTDIISTKGLPETCKELDISNAPIHILEDIPEDIHFVRTNLCPIEDISRVPPVALHCILGLSFDMQEKVYQTLSSQPKQIQEEAYQKLLKLPQSDKVRMQNLYEQWQQRHFREEQIRHNQAIRD